MHYNERQGDVSKETNKIEKHPLSGRENSTERACDRDDKI